jgi:glycosyltransferase 2 family protein
VDWREVFTTLRQLDLVDVIVLVLVDLCILVTISARWWLLLSGFGHRLPFRRLIRYRTTVTGLSYITPGPQLGGEVLQVYYPVHDHDVPTAVALAVTSVDKTLEFLVNFTFMAVGTFVVLIGEHLIANLDTPAMLAVISLLLIPIVLVFSVARGNHPLSRIVIWVARILPSRWRIRLRKLPVLKSLPNTARFEHAIFHTEELIEWLFRTRPWTLVLTVVVGYLALGLIILEFWLMTRALNLPITPGQAIGTLVLVYFSFLMPVPAGLGAMEASMVLAFSAFGYPPAQAISLGLLMRVRDLAQAGIGLALGGIHMGAGFVPYADDPEVEVALDADEAERRRKPALNVDSGGPTDAESHPG